jgi:hypothetical protein
MSADGFLLGGFEAPVPQGGIWNALPLPFQLGRFRPDGWGVDIGKPLFGFAEAKSLDDIDTGHTRNQLKTLGFVSMRNSSQKCPLYIAVPRSEKDRLDRVLKDVDLLGAEHVRRIEVPDILLRRA